MGMNNVKGLWLVLVLYIQYFFRVYLLESKRFGQLLHKQPFTRGELIQQHFNVLAKFKKRPSKIPNNVVECCYPNMDILELKHIRSVNFFNFHIGSIAKFG
jgi:hypothetical protein